MAEKFTNKEVEEVFADARQKVAKIIGLPEDLTSDDRKFNATFFKFKNFAAVDKYLDENHLGKNLQAHNLSSSMGGNNHTDSYLLTSFPQDFLSNPNGVMERYMQAAKESGLAQNVDLESVKLNQRQIAAIDWAGKKGDMRAITENYELRATKQGLAQRACHQMKKWPKKF